MEEKKKKYTLAIVGVTGLVGRNFLTVLEEKGLSFENCYFFASPKSVGKKVRFMGKEYEVLSLSLENIVGKNIDIALFSAGGQVSEEFAPVFAKLGATVIDNSSRWRMKEDVPLVIPEINPEDILFNKGIIANPNCSTIQATVCLKPLMDAFGIKRVVISTYQAVSGAGMQGILDLQNHSKGIPPKKIPRQIAYNVVPQIDAFTENGYTVEEEKIIRELRKILHKPSLRITATCVRVPVLYCHSESINVEFERKATLKDIIKVLQSFPSIRLNVDDYYTPIEIENLNEVFISRLRTDTSVPYGCNFFCIADNLRKGASTNAVQIAELLMNNGI